MRIAICDDQAVCLEQTSSAIRKCVSIAEARIDLYKDGLSFLSEFKSHPYDLVFLDIEMPAIDGITLAKKLRGLSADVPIIFLTSHIEYALEGYEVNALRYLTKPVDPNKLRDVLSVVMERIRKARTLWIKTDMGEQKLLIKDILFLEAQNQNILINTAKETFCVRYNLSDYEQELAEDGFFRIHRGYLVSLSHVRSVGKAEVTLDDNTVLPVSRTKVRSIKEALVRQIRKEAF